LTVFSAYLVAKPPFVHYYGDTEQAGMAMEGEGSCPEDLIIRKEKTMKTTRFALLLLAVLAFVLAGCSDKSMEPMMPADQSVSTPASLEKNVVTDFSGGLMYPTGVLFEGITRFPDGKMTIRGMLATIVLDVPGGPGITDLLSGPGELELNGTVTDPVNGVGEFWGKLTLKPTALNVAGVQQGVWELSWHGKGTIGPQSPWAFPPDPQTVYSFGWTLPLKEPGHGKGGAIDGMKCYFDNTIFAAPTMSPWIGVISGYIQSH
jgi:hypothetical protein